MYKAYGKRENGTVCFFPALEGGEFSLCGRAFNDDGEDGMLVLENARDEKACDCPDCLEVFNYYKKALPKIKWSKK